MFSGKIVGNRQKNTGKDLNFMTQQIMEMQTQTELIQAATKVLDLKTEIGKRALRRAFENIKLLDKKQIDYGSKNISLSGEIGVQVRLQDKVCRLKNLLENDANSPKNESIYDTYQDIANYGIIGDMLKRGEWISKPIENGTSGPNVRSDAPF